MIFGDNPFGYHLMSLAVHISVVALIYIFTMQISKDKNISLVSGLIFAAHPLHVESVSFIVAITDPITALFMLVTSILFGKFLSYKSHDKKKACCYIVSLITFVCALLSKEMGVTVPILLCLYEYIYLKMEDKNIIPSFQTFVHHIPFFVILGIYLIIRGMILDPITNTPHMTLYHRILNVPYLITEYIRLLFFPVNLSLLRDIPTAKGLLDAIFYIPVIILTVIGLLMIKTYRYMTYSAFALIWFLITLIPVLNIIPMPYPALFDRFAYIPSIGFTILISLTIGRIMKLEIIKKDIVRYCVYFFLSLMLIFFSITSIRRTFIWTNDLTLWSNSIKKSPDSKVARINLGYYYDRIGEIDRAIKEYKEAIRIDPDYYFAHNNLGVLFQRKGMLDLAAKELKKTIQLKPGFDMAHNNLGNLYFELREIPSASREYKEAIRLNPQNFIAHFNLGNMYYLSNSLDSAIKEYQITLLINPVYVEAYYRLGNTYNKIGRKEEAINHYEKFVRAANKKRGFEQYIKTAKKRMKILIQSRQQ